MKYHNNLNTMKQALKTKLQDKTKPLTTVDLSKPEEANSPLYSQELPNQ